MSQRFQSLDTAFAQAVNAFVHHHTGSGMKYCILCGQGSHRADWVSDPYPTCDNHTEDDVLTRAPVGWFLLRKGASSTMTNIVTPDDMPKLTFSQQAYNNLPDPKRRILFKLKKRSAVQTVNDTCTEIVWYLDPQVFLEMTTEFPWLLDKNLGETEAPDDFWYSPFRKQTP